jgi:excisionase family DNA binding protein
MAHCTTPDIPLNERLTLTMGEAAALTGLCVATLYELRARGVLRTIKIGGRRLVPRDALDELLGVAGHVSASERAPAPQPRRRGRPSKVPAEGRPNAPREA